MISDSNTATNIIFPQSSAEQGYAFEYLILCFFQKECGINVESFSAYNHGKDQKWYQIDGIVNSGKRQLVEAKFYQDDVGCREINPDRRIKAAQAFDCEEIIFVSLNGFKQDIKDWARSADMQISFIEWNDLRSDILNSCQGTITSLLDEVEITAKSAKSLEVAESAIHFSSSPSTSTVDGYPEFLVYPDDVERWIRRIPRLNQWRQQLVNGSFRYSEGDKPKVKLIPHSPSFLSIEEAWEIQDAFSGYAARTYSALQITAQALKFLSGSAPIETITLELHESFQVSTGKAGVRDSLNSLSFMGFVNRPSVRRGNYSLTALGWAYVRNDETDDELFRDKLSEWLPFRYLRIAIEEYCVKPNPRAIVEWFKVQYAPYEPYAKSLFNANKTDGLLKWYKQLNY